MVKDRQQKDMLYKHFRAQGWMAYIEVPVMAVGGVNPKSPAVTDVDVLGFRPSSDLRWQLIVGDCKTRRKESPVNRVLWVRGVQEALGASSAIVLLKQTNAHIERDHKLFAERLGALLIEESEFTAYDRAVVYPAGSTGFEESIDALDAIRIGVSTNFPALKDFVQWILGGAWSVADHAVVLRRLLGLIRDQRGEFDPARNDHMGLILETTSAFAIPFATLVGTVFRRHLKPNQRTDLEEAVRVIVWGGREQYEFYNALRRKAIEARGGDPSSDLALPAWPEFLELLRSYLEVPHLAFRTPQVLRSLALDVVSGGTGNVLSHVEDRMLLSLAMKLALYVCSAAGLPQDAGTRVKGMFTSRIAHLVERSTKPTGDRVFQQDLLMGQDVDQRPPD